MQVLLEAKRYVFSRIVKLSPQFASKLLYWRKFKRNLHLVNPQTFNEKLMWLKLYEDIAYKTKNTDKVETRKYITSLGLEHLLAPIIDIVDRVDDIIFEQLPRRFVLKCSHGPGLNIICTDKRQLDYQSTKQQLAKWMAIDYSLINAEVHYSKIQPRIIIEHFLGQSNSEVPIDYKIHCFHGEPKIIELTIEDLTSQKQSVMLTPDWKDTQYTKQKFAYDVTKLRPKQLEELLAIAQKISRTFTYVRVDLYIMDEKIYFGELTFTPEACLNDEIHEEANLELGQWLDLDFQKLKGPITIARSK